MTVTAEQLKLAQSRVDPDAQVAQVAGKVNDSAAIIDKAGGVERPERKPGVGSPFEFPEDGAVVPPKTIPDVKFPGVILEPLPAGSQIPGVIVTPTPAAPVGVAGTQSLGNPQFDGMLNQIVQLNTDIDSLLADYQKAVNGELLDASGKKVDPFVIQMKLQQAMQQRLEISNLLSTLMKMVHDGIEAITRNIA